MKNDLFKRASTNFKLDYYWLNSRRIGLLERLAFLFRKYSSIISNKREIKYLGKKFYYDNRFSPAILQSYPKEIEQINKTINLSKINTVLDVGANIGQFSVTLSSLFPHIRSYSFEPNTGVFKTLQKNLSRSKNQKSYPFGLGLKPGKRTFYFSPSASAEGSFYQENINQNFIRKDVNRVKVDIITPTRSELRRKGIPTKFDLVKIDVEGSEMEVLKSLRSIKFDYLFIEVSVKRKGEGLKEVKKYLTRSRGIEPRLIYYNLPEKDSASANVMLSLK